MVLLNIESLEINPNDKHIATDWEISDTQNFKNIIASSIGDTANITSIHFNIVLDPGVKYYARARALIEGKGYTIWSNLDIFKIKTYNDFDNTIDLPTSVATPIITTSSSVDNHMPTLFKIYAKGFSVIGNAKHIATSWFVEDLDGKTMWQRTFDTINKTEILPKDLILADNTVYRIKAMFHTSSNDTSALGCKTIKTAPAISEPITSHFLKQLRNMDFSVENTVIFPKVVGAESYTVSISEITNDVAQDIAIYTHVNNECTISIKPNTIRKNCAYVIVIEPDVGESVTYYFYTFME